MTGMEASRCRLFLIGDHTRKKETDPTFDDESQTAFDSTGWRTSQPFVFEVRWLSHFIFCEESNQRVAVPMETGHPEARAKDPQYACALGSTDGDHAQFCG